MIKRRASVPTLLLATLTFGACAGDDAQDAAEATTTTAVPAETGPTSSPTTTTTTSTTLPSTTSVPLATTTAAPTTVAPTTVPPAPVLPAGFSISVPVGGGEGNLTYSEELVEQLVEGPSSMSVDDHGGLYISDPVARRVLSIRGDDRVFIDLAPLGVGWIDDVLATDDHLVVLDRDLGGPINERVLLVSYAGELIEEIPIPAEFGVDASVQGFFDTGDDDRVVLRYIVPFAAEWDRGSQLWAFREPIEVGGVDVARADGDLQVGAALLTVDASLAQQHWAGLHYLGHAEDGRWIVDRWDGVSGVEWWSADGQFLGAATTPEGQFAEEGYAVTATSDGRVFALNTRPDAVVVTELVPQSERIITP